MKPLSSPLACLSHNSSAIYLNYPGKKPGYFQDKILSACILLTLLFVSTGLHAQRITVTLAGNGSSGADSTPAFTFGVYNPKDVCVDAAHNIYISETGDGRIQKIIASNGKITHIAGGGSSTADGIPATAASINPQYLCIDGAGNLYFTTPNQVKKINAGTGIITTIAGTGATGYSGDGGLAIGATFNNLWGICVDALGNIFVVDQGNNCIRKINGVTGVITRFAGTSISGYSGDGGPATAATLLDPSVICVNASGDVYIADQTLSSTSRIRKIAAVTGTITTIAGGSSILTYGLPAIDALLGQVTGMCCDASGNLFINEISCSCHEIDMTTGMLNIVGGNYEIEDYSDDTTSTGAWMNFPYGLCIDATNNLYVADMFNNRIRKLIQLTHSPKFAHGEGQSINACAGIAFVLGEQLDITDIDTGQTETWTVLSAPTNGTLSGFPLSMLSVGENRPLSPASLLYTPASGFTGTDSFKVRVSDGIFSDTVTIYAAIKISNPGVITTSSPSLFCQGAVYMFSDTVFGGTWSLTNGNAYISSPFHITTVSAGIDTIVYTVTPISTGCAVTTTHVITITPLPVAGTINGDSTVCSGATISMTDTAEGGTWSSAYTNASISTDGIVTGTATGPDTIKYAVTNVCGTAIATKTIVIDTFPVAGPITGMDSVCEGATITLSDTAAGGIWTVYNGHASVLTTGIVNGISQGTDTIGYSVSNMCGTAHMATMITIKPLPTITPIIGDTSMCVGGTIVLTDSTSGGMWTQSNAHGVLSGSVSLVGLSAGIDTVFYVTYNTCGSVYASHVITINDCNNTGIYTPALTSQISIYPNPASSILNIEWSDQKTGDASIKITDIAGRVVLNQSAAIKNSNRSGTTQVDISGLTQGIYLLSVHSQSGSFIDKLLINK